MKQPRVPEYRENEGASKHLKALTLFLKDFCMDVWVAIRNTEKKVPEIEYPVTSVNGETGDVQLDAQDVGALSSDPQEGEEAPDMGAVPINADKLEGKSLFEILLMRFPIGSIYISLDEESPASLFGGTWELIKDRFLIGAGGNYVLNSTGGEAEHTLTVAEMPSHDHMGGFNDLTVSTGTKSYARPTEYAYSAEYKLTLPAGGSQPHNNMPPYLAVNIWKRVA